MKINKEWIREGEYHIYLKGSRETIRRVVYRDTEWKRFVWFYGQWIEVRRNAQGYTTIMEF